MKLDFVYAGTQQQPLVIQTAPIQAATAANVPPTAAATAGAAPQAVQGQLQLQQGQQVYALQQD